jgi:hypothetical protein
MVIHVPFTLFVLSPFRVFFLHALLDLFRHDALIRRQFKARLQRVNALDSAQNLNPRSDDLHDDNQPQHLRYRTHNDYRLQ